MSDAAQVDIVLPEARIEGRVIDEAGRPVTSGVVQFQSKKEGDELGVFAMLRDAEEGHFRFGGLPPGDYQVWAEARDGRQSETAQTKLADRSSVVLVLGGAVLVEGQVVSSMTDILVLWAQPQGGGLREGKLVLPALAPGDYTVCNARGMPDELRPRLAGTPGAFGSSCVSGSLHAGATLELRAPGRAP